MNARLRIPTKTQYAFIEVDFEGDASAIVAAYNQINDAYWNQKEVGALPEKEWRIFLEKVMLNEPNHIDQYEKCSPEKKKTINEIKKTLKRLESRQ